MANQEHIEWLLQGVKFWNARLASLRLDDPLFIPDFENAPLYSIFQNAGELGRFGSIPLAGADLFRANLSFADLTRADLKGANLWRANLKGAKLGLADLTDANLAGAELWKAFLYLIDINPPEQPQDTKNPVTSITDLLDAIHELRYGSTTTLYFRGESASHWELRPSVMRDDLAAFESDMLVALVSQRPEEFNGMTSALAQWVLARHHRLQTRFLDITRNPLVALFHACDKTNGEDQESIDGRLHVFAVDRPLIKTFNSDTISVIANIARLSQREQRVILGERVSLRDFTYENEHSIAMHKLYQMIQQEKPYFDERIDPRDFYRVFVVEPQLSSERIRAQSGAFLVSAFHERFERSKILELSRDIPVYAHYTLTIPGNCKDDIMESLQLLNITRENLFPGLDSSAEAVTDSYRSLMYSMAIEAETDMDFF